MRPKILGSEFLNVTRKHQSSDRTEQKWLCTDKPKVYLIPTENQPVSLQLQLFRPVCLQAVNPQKNIVSKIKEYDVSFLDLDIDTAASVGEGPLGRGLFSDSPTRSAPLISVPLCSCLIVGSDACNLGSKTAQRLPERLSTILSCPGRIGGDESGGYEDHRGPWQRYLRLLPQMEDLTNLISFSPAERLCLQIPELMDECIQQRNWAKQQHELHLKPLSKSLDNSRWALALARSRTVGFELHGDGYMLVLPPAIDMANHGTADSVNCRVRLDLGGERLVLEPLKLIEAGEELLIDYGHSRSNLDLMCDYGFIITGNNTDLVALPTNQIPSLQPLDLGRLQLAASQVAVDESLPASKAAFSSTATDEAGRVKAALASLNASCRSIISKPSSSAGAYCGPASASAWIDVVEGSLAALPTTADEDCRLLSAISACRHDGGDTSSSSLTHPSSPRAEMAVRARLEHKLVLINVVKILRHYLVLS